MDKLNIVKAVYYQLVVMGFHPVIGGSTALYVRGLVDDFNDINVIIEKEEFDKIKPPFDLISEDDPKKPIRCRGYRYYNVVVKLIENALPHPMNFEIINDIRYSTIADVNESRQYILQNFKDVTCLNMTEELVMKWTKQLF